jgi:hypothetical protein
LKISNNIAAGMVQIGISGPAHKCGSTNKNFFNNVAHSISDGCSGNGLLVYPDPSDPSQKECFEIDSNAAYKCTDAGVFANFGGKTV